LVLPSPGAESNLKHVGTAGHINISLAILDPRTVIRGKFGVGPSQTVSETETATEGNSNGKLADLAKGLDQTIPKPYAQCRTNPAVIIVA